MLKNLTLQGIRKKICQNMTPQGLVTLEVNLPRDRYQFSQSSGVWSLIPG